MTFNAKVSVQEGLDLLAERLDSIISERLAETLNGLSWTVILRELDQAKGHSHREYSSRDLQAQLRILTERLGGLGYPFDDPRTRIVSTLGGELRIMRNRWAHGYDLTELDAWRTHDFAVRLLEHFSDAEGLEAAEALRMSALAAVAKSSGVIPSATGTIEPKPAAPSPAVENAPVDEPDEHVTPDPSVLVRRNAADTPSIGAERSEFEAWTVVPAGEISVLEDLPKKAAKEQVRAVAIEIAEFEGPIHVDRLAELTAASFGLNKLHAKRRAQISRQIAASGLHVDADKFVWPASIDPHTWTEFRPNSSDIDRPFLRISPVEIANAARFIQVTGQFTSRDELETMTLQTFGRKRRTAQFTRHLVRSLGS